MFLQGKTALITGSTSGIGLGYARALAAEGANVMINGFGDADAIQGYVAELAAASGGKALQSGADMMKPDEIRAMVAECSEKLGAPDILINNAGIQHVAPVDEFPEDKWDAIMSIILSSAFHTTKAALPAMKAKGWGRIVNFASLQTTRAFPGGIAYGATKAGVGQLTRAMAEAWSPHGITANAIGPGFFPTELTQAVFSDPERARRNAAQTCLGRNGLMEDLDGPLLFLCSQASAYVTGQVLMVDGGFTAK